MQPHTEYSETSAIVVTCRHGHEVEVGVQGAAVDGVKRHPYLVHAAARLQIKNLAGGSRCSRWLGFRNIMSPKP